MFFLLSFTQLVKVLLSILVLAIAFNNFPASAKDPSEHLTINIVGNTLPPFGYTEEEELAGFSIEMLQYLLARSEIANLSITSQHTSFARAFSQLENRKNTIALHFARSPAREEKFKWLGPYYMIKMGVVGLSSDSKAYSNINSIKGKPIAVVTDTLIEDILIDKGIDLNNMVFVSNPLSGLRMLNAGRIEFFAHIPSVLRYLMQNELDLNASAIDEKLTLQTGYFYFALSQDFDDEFVSSLQSLLNEMQYNNDFSSLYAKYGLDAKLKR